MQGVVRYDKVGQGKVWQGVLRYGAAMLGEVGSGVYTISLTSTIWYDAKAVSNKS